MICLDTNDLILGVTEGTREARERMAWAQAGEPLITPTPAWFEFLCGPVTPVRVATLRTFLGEIVAFDEAQAAKAARRHSAICRTKACCC
jgi:hypothetical protein